MKTIVVLKNIVSEKGLYDERGPVKATFLVGYQEDGVTLSHELILTSDGDGWSAQMPMSDFPQQRTVTAAAWKLADWMEKMSKAIKAKEFDTFNLNSL